MAVLRRSRLWRHIKNQISITLSLLFLFICLLKLVHVITVPIAKKMAAKILKDNPGPKLYPQTQFINNTSDYFVPKSLNKIDWHNYDLINKDLERFGLGEQGHPAKLPKIDKALVKSLFAVNGFNAALSDQISVNRSLSDLRHIGCRSKRYLESLPTVTVVVPFHNEHWSTLLRTVYSVLNRSPPQLLKEIFLVDDASTKLKLKQRLDIFVNENLTKVKVLRLYKRSGVVAARLTGAREVTTDVIVFLDSHTEVTHNWLPPLLEPIALNYRTAVCPFIGIIAYDTFKNQIQDPGARGAFNWELFYKRLPMLPKDRENMPEPFESPIMAGGLFAISYKFFWELGGYDPGLAIWGGEEFELSFKIWMCGGRILDAPCSFVGHIYKKNSPFNNPGIGEYLPRNHRRIAEVWMDEYAQYLYNRRPSYVWINPGDISEQIALRKKLNCKSFRWFMTQVAFDLSAKFPPVEPQSYASGEIRPLSHPFLCVDAHHGKDWERLEITQCVNIPRVEQRFVFGWLKDIKSQFRDMCWDLPESKPRSPVLLYGCHGEQRNQYWRYFLDTKQIVHVESNKCLAWDPSSLFLFIDICDDVSKTQKWMVDNINKDMMDRWERNNLLVTGPIEKYE